MKRMSAAILVVLLAAGAGAQDKKDVDKIGKDKAPVVLKKALAEVQKKKSAAIKEIAELTAGPQKIPASTFEGIQRKDFAGVKGAAEVYAKGSFYLVNLGGRFDPPDQVEGQDAFAARATRIPRSCSRSSDATRRRRSSDRTRRSTARTARPWMSPRMRRCSSNT